MGAPGLLLLLNQYKSFLIATLIKGIWLNTALGNAVFTTVW